MPDLSIKTRNGGAASESPLASRIGANILSEGGNAVDAAAAVSYAITVTLPHLGGIGGDFFAMIREPDGIIRVVNGSGPAPKGLTRGLLVGEGYKRMPDRGGLSITIPGLVDGTWLMWREHGSMEWSKLISPSVELAVEGFPAPGTLVDSVKSLMSKLSWCEGARKTYMGIVERGQTIKFPGLAKLLTMISEDHRVFYEGDPAERIVEEINKNGGVFDARDMASYKSYITKPVSIEYNGWTIWEMPPNTQGITTLHIIKLLKDTPPRIDSNSLRKILQAYQIAYYIRDNYLGDLDHMKYMPDQLLKEEFLGQIKESLVNQSPWGSGDTTFFITADGEGRIVLGIQSLFHHFGSLVTEPRYQIPLNARAACFTLKPGIPNTVAPSKLPLHTLSTVIMEKDERVIGFGLSAGHYRPQFHAQIAKMIIDRGENPVSALQAPRLAWRPWTNELVVDKELASVIGSIKGYKVNIGRTGVGAVIESMSGLLRLATDWRGEGIPSAARS